MPKASLIKPAAVYQEALGNLERFGIEGLVVVGGEGTLTIAAEFRPPRLARSGRAQDYR